MADSRVGAALAGRVAEFPWSATACRGADAGAVLAGLAGDALAARTVTTVVAADIAAAVWSADARSLGTSFPSLALATDAAAAIGAALLVATSGRAGAIAALLAFFPFRGQ